MVIEATVTAGGHIPLYEYYIYVLVWVVASASVCDS